MFDIPPEKSSQKTPKTVHAIHLQCGFISENPKRPGPRLNIKTVIPRYGDSDVKGKTIGETVLS